MVAVAARAYGFVVGDTCGYGVLVETDGMVSPAAKYAWTTLGILDDGSGLPCRDLLKGLITEARLYVVAPPH